MNKSSTLPQTISPSKTIFSVSELNLASQKILENHFPEVWVEGEISNLSRPASGHIYFSLKDAKAQIRAAFFRQYSRQLNFELRNGLLVQAKACVSVYPDRGDYQLIVEAIEPAGEGLLRQAYEKLLNTLKEQGLFEQQHKQTLAKFPKRVGIVTSATGAALRDILHVLQRRFPSIEAIIFPTMVQGPTAAPEIVSAIERANALQDNQQNALCDVLLVCRGGGSLEDLWPFNEEIVALAIFNSRIPIVTGIGHETDFTIADFVADLRAPTPSAAAECISPDQQDILRRLQSFESLFLQHMNQRLNYAGQRLDYLTKRLRHPGQFIETAILQLQNLYNRMNLAIQKILDFKQHSLSELVRTLDAISPEATLKRGYAIVTNEKNQIIRSAEEVKVGDTLAIRLNEGNIKGIITDS